MSLETERSIELYDGNGVTAVFPFTFKAWTATNVRVYRNILGAQEDVTESVTVSLNSGGGGGTVTFAEAPLSGTRIAICRKMPFVQEDRYVSGTRIDPQALEDRFDQDCAERQELRDAIGRCVQVSETSDYDADELMTAVEENAVAIEQAKAEALAAIEEIREANYAPLSRVETLEGTVEGVSNVADGAADNAQDALDAIGTLDSAVASAASDASDALALANQAISIAQGAMSYKGEVATTGDLPAGASAGDIWTVAADGKLYISDGAENWAEFSAVAVDQSIIASSPNPVAGGAVKTALDAKADDNAVVHLAGAENVTAKKTWTTANTGPEVTNTSNTLKVGLRSSDTPRAGLYDVTNSEWLIRRNGNGSFDVSAKVSGGTAKTLEGKTDGTLTWDGADITGDAKKANLPANVKDYGAKGDGVTNDTAAFTSFESSVTGKVVDLMGGTYVLDSNYSGNTYVNGKFKISGVTIEKPAVIEAADEIPQDAGKVVFEIPYMNKGKGKWVYGAQCFARNGASMYVLQSYEDSSQQAMVHRYTFNANGDPVYADSSGVSPALGHQGLAADASGRLVMGWSEDNVKDPFFMGRVTYSAGSVLTPTKIRLFPSTYGPGSLSPTPSLSKDKRWLVARSVNASSEHVLRIWDYMAISEVSSVKDSDNNIDWSELYAREIKIPDVPRTVTTPMQGLLMDKSHIYVVCGGNALSKNKHLYVYDMEGRLCRKTTTFHVGFDTADTYGGKYEPEGLNFVEYGGTSHIGLMFVCGTGKNARHVYVARFAG